MSSLTELAQSIENPATPEVGEHGVTATPERVRYAFEHGGRAVVTVRSHKTGKHVVLTFTARKRKPGGGWLPRNTTAGRVGIAEADALEVRDAQRPFGENYVGRLYLREGEWRAAKDADAARVYAAEKVIAYALNGATLLSEVSIAAQCSYCGKQLSDPESIERGVGPECYGKATKSQAAAHEEVK